LERVRWLGHVRGNTHRPRPGRGGEAARRDRTWGRWPYVPRGRPAGAPGWPGAGSEIAGRHRWESAEQGGDCGPSAARAAWDARGGGDEGAPRRGEPPPAPAGDPYAGLAGDARARVRPEPYGTALPGPGTALPGPGTAPPDTPAMAAGAGRKGWLPVRRASGVRSGGPDAPAGRERAGGAGRPAGQPQQPWYEVAARRGAAGSYLPARNSPAAASQGGLGSVRPRLPFAQPHEPGKPSTGDGRRHCGSLESVLWRQWDPAVTPPPETVLAVDRLAELPQQIKATLVAGLDGIYVGPGGVPDLDHMTGLHGVPLRSGRATWDACAGAYGERRIVVGTRPSPTPDVMCHEVGHALDDLDAPPGKWQSDSAEFRALYDQCEPHLASGFHRQRGGLGRKEFFADAFAAIASRQRPALVDMLSGNTRVALTVMLYFNRRYGI
jgi:hypothetical protein